MVLLKEFRLLRPWSSTGWVAPHTNWEETNDSPYLKGFKLKLEGEGDDVLVDNFIHKPQFSPVLRKKWNRRKQIGNVARKYSNAYILTHKVCGTNRMNLKSKYTKALYCCLYQNLVDKAHEWNRQLEGFKLFERNKPNRRWSCATYYRISTEIIAEH